MSIIIIQCFDSIVELANLRDQINALNQASDRPDPFSTLEFYENYFQHDQLPSWDDGCRLMFLGAFSEERLVGYLALKRTSERFCGLPATKLSFFAADDVDRPHMITSPEYAVAVGRAMSKYLFDGGRTWSMLELRDQVRDRAPLGETLDVDCNVYVIRTWPSWNNWTIPIRWGSLQGYFADLSKQFRSNVGRQMRSLFAAGNLELLSSSDPAVTPALLELYRGVEAHSWKTRAGLAVGRSAERIRYFQGLLEARQPMQICILVLLLDGVPVAGAINGAYCGGLYALQISFDDGLSQLSPGSAMLLMTMWHAVIDKYRFCNLLSGFDYFKSRWLADSTEAESVQYFRVGTPLFWRRVIGDAVRRLLVRTTRRLPVLFNPSRREVSTTDGAAPKRSGASGVQRTPDERARIATLIAESRRGSCRFLTAEALAAAMPFEVCRGKEGGRSTSAVGVRNPCKRGISQRETNVGVPPMVSTGVRP